MYFPQIQANHLFGRYLRSESYRKALIWQKRYLTALLATYQNFRPFTERLPLNAFEVKNSKKTKSSTGTGRFKSAALAVVAIVRMRYLVLRWNTGKRIGCYKVHSQQLKSPSMQFKTAPSGVQLNNAFNEMRRKSENRIPLFEENKIPLFEENKTPSKGGPSNAWSGLTPPSKDVSSEPLKSPELLRKYVERFSQIQSRLGMALDDVTNQT